MLREVRIDEGMNNKIRTIQKKGLRDQGRRVPPTQGLHHELTKVVNLTVSVK